MTFGIRIKAVVKVIALQVKLFPDDIIVIESAAPGRIDTAVIASSVDAHGGCV